MKVFAWQTFKRMQVNMHSSSNSHNSLLGTYELFSFSRKNFSSFFFLNFLISTKLFLTLTKCQTKSWIRFHITILDLSTSTNWSSQQQATSTSDCNKTFLSSNCSLVSAIAAIYRLLLLFTLYMMNDAIVSNKIQSCSPLSVLWYCSCITFGLPWTWTKAHYFCLRIYYVICITSC